LKRLETVNDYSRYHFARLFFASAIPVLAVYPPEAALTDMSYSRTAQRCSLFLNLDLFLIPSENANVLCQWQ